MSGSSGGDWNKALETSWYKVSIRRSKRAGGREFGEDIVIIAEMKGDGRRDSVTGPPIEWATMRICRSGLLYNESMYLMEAAM